MWNKIKIGIASLLLPLLAVFIYDKDKGDGLDIIIDEPSQIIFIGDQGTGNKNQKRVAKLVNKEHKNSLIVTLGDNWYPIGLENEKQFKESLYVMYPTHNIAIVGGNHDVFSSALDIVNPFSKYYDSHTLLKELAAKYSRIIYPSRFYTIKAGRYCVLVWDSTIYTAFFTGDFVKRQTKYIEKFIKRNDCKIKISAAHHGYITAGKHGNATGKLKRVYEKLLGKVEFIFQGHNHNLAFLGNETGSEIYTSGSGGKLRACVKQPKGGWCISKLGYLVLKGKQVRKVIYE